MGDRNLAVNLLTGLGNLATGFIPFFKNTSSQSTFKTFVAIFSNPFTEGFKLAAPDLTIDQAFKLGDFSFRNDLDTKTIISSNTQIVTMIFFPKRFLYPETDGAKKKSKKQKNDPQAVMRDLGEVVLIGRKVEFSNRIRLNSNQRAVPSTSPSN